MRLSGVVCDAWSDGRMRDEISKTLRTDKPET